MTVDRQTAVLAESFGSDYNLTDAEIDRLAQAIQTAIAEEVKDILKERRAR